MTKRKINDGVREVEVTVKLRVRVRISSDDLDNFELSRPDFIHAAKRAVMGEFNAAAQGGYTIEQGAIHEMDLIDWS